MQRSELSRLYKKRSLQLEEESQPSTPFLIGLECLQILYNLSFRDRQPSVENAVRVGSIAISILVLYRVNGQNFGQEYAVSIMIRLLMVAAMCFFCRDLVFII